MLFVHEIALRHTSALGLRVSSLERRGELERDFRDVEVFGTGSGSSGGYYTALTARSSRR